MTENPARAFPRAGEQFAFKVDLKTCTGCKGCVTACHNLNGLKPEESWRSTGVIESFNGGLSQTITTSCHHCLDPACLTGCPTLAYVKDPETGVVLHLDDQCIGCQYCILRCPYQAPKWIPSLGIVRKCDLCIDRLKVGEETACQQGCPNDAISITIVSKAEIQAQGDWPIPVAAPWKFTQPTTQYIGLNPSQQTKALQEEVEPEEGHLPLVIMLIFTQMSVGLWFTGFFMEQQRVLQSVALGVGILGLVASVFHLGHPEKAFRAFLGFRTSWLSREVVFFGTYTPLIMLSTSLRWYPGVQPSFVLPLAQLVGVSALVFGLCGLFSSAKVYQSTPRLFWKGSKALVGFPLTAVLLGCSFASEFANPKEQPLLLWLVLISSLVFLSLELQRYKKATQRDPFFGALLQGPLKSSWGLQRYGLIVFGIMMPVALLYLGNLTPLKAFLFYGLLGTCFFERQLFFRLGLGPRMPKGEAG